MIEAVGLTKRYGRTVAVDIFRHVPNRTRDRVLGPTGAEVDHQCG